MVKRLDEPRPPSEEIKHFTNRENERAIFGAALDKPTLPLPALMFFGVGGIGKTWLLTRLSLDIPAEVPHARLNLDNERYQHDYATALATIRRSFHEVDCARFDNAYGWMRAKQGTAADPTVRGSGLVGNVWEAIAEGGEAILSDVPGNNIVSWMAQKLAKPVWQRVKGTHTVQWLLTQAGQDDWLRLMRMTADDILGELPRRLLADLKGGLPAGRLKRACRGVVFLDTYEALNLGIRGEAQRDHRERWVRDLYAPDSPLLLVISGRDRLQWERVDADFAQTEYLEQHLIGGLSEADARLFLARCGTEERDLQDAVLQVCPDDNLDVSERGYHPFSLGLCADTLAVRRERGLPTAATEFDFAPGDKRELAQRFLKSLDDPGRETWVKMLALTPRFHEQAARLAFSSTASADQGAAWRELLDYSFVRSTYEPGWFTLHIKMREALCDASGRGFARKGQEEWKQIWQSCSSDPHDAAAALSWYHQSCIDELSALVEWERLAEDAKKQLEMQRHFELLNWWSLTDVMATVSSTQMPLRSRANTLHSVGIEWSEATIGDRGENLRQAIACYQAALRVRTEADFPQDWAMTNNNLGNAYAGLPTGDRGENLRQAIACYQAALRVRTEADFPQDWAMTNNNLRIALAKLKEPE